MRKTLLTIVAAALCLGGQLLYSPPASAHGYRRHHIRRVRHHWHHRRHHRRWHHRGVSRRWRRSGCVGACHDYHPPWRGLVRVHTAAGITITVSPQFAPKIEGFIRDLVASGYHPRRIHCYARSGHVRHSLHYTGNACDFDQRGWGLTDRMMYHVSGLAAKWGLRDGAEFRDWGHIDNGRGPSRVAW